MKKIFRSSLFQFVYLVTLFVIGGIILFLVATKVENVADQRLGRPAASPSPIDQGLSFGPLLYATLDPTASELFVSGLTNPHGLGVYGGELFVSSWGQRRIYRVDLASGGKKLLSDELAGAHDMVFDRFGNLVTPLYQGGRVVKISLKTGKVTTLAEGFNGPNGIAVSRDGGFFVSNVGDGTVVKVNDKGQKRIVAKDLKEPAGIVVDNDNIVRIAQYGDPVNSVVQIQDNGKTSVIVKDLVQAETLLYDDHKNLLIGHTIDGKGAVTMFSASGTVKTVFRTDLPGPFVGPVTDGVYLYFESAMPDQTKVYRILLPK